MCVDSSNWSEEAYVSEYLDDNLFEIIVEATNRTSVLRTGRTLGLSINEFKVWLGINYVMSAVQYPVIRMYWMKDWRVPIIAAAMNRDRFFAIRNRLKCVFDPDILPAEREENRLWKVAPLLQKILEGCHKQERDVHISIDEMIIPFTGMCGFKQYIRGKPNPVGVKLFVLANPNGIVCDYLFYQGDKTFKLEYKDFPLGTAAILQLSSTLVPGHVIYHDRFFTSLRLADELLKRGLFSTGTLAKNRIPKNVDLKDEKELKKMGRGSHDTVTRCDGTVTCVHWYDNKSVVMLSTAQGVDPISRCQRWSKKGREYIDIPRPDVVATYNTSMGGVDMAGRMLSYCASRARTKKWTVRVILHMFDMAITNSWLKYRSDKLKKGQKLKSIKQLRLFKIDFGKTLIENGSEKQNEASSQSEESDDETSVTSRFVPQPSKRKRTNRSDHMPQLHHNIYKRCRFQGCRSKTNVECSKCKMFLCLTSKRNHYTEYHRD